MECWLQWQSRGLVILPAQRWNEAFTHPNTLRYDGINLEQIRETLVRIRERAEQE